MLIIRKSQIDAFEKIAVRRFEDGLLEHLQTFFPTHAATLGEKQNAPQPGAQKDNP